MPQLDNNIFFDCVFFTIVVFVFLYFFFLYNVLSLIYCSFRLRFLRIINLLNTILFTNLLKIFSTIYFKFLFQISLSLYIYIFKLFYLIQFNYNSLYFDLNLFFHKINSSQSILNFFFFNEIIPFNFFASLDKPLFILSEKFWAIRAFI